jgi:DNA-binding XRE family transcriptional regulator
MSIEVIYKHKILTSIESGIIDTHLATLNIMAQTYSTSQKTFLKKIGKRIRVLRKKAGFSQETLAFNSHLDRSYIGAVERGEKNPSAISLKKIAKALNVSLSTLWKT